MNLSRFVLLILCALVMFMTSVKSVIAEVFTIKPDFVIIDSEPVKLELVLSFDLKDSDTFEIQINGKKVNAEKIDSKTLLISLVSEDLEPGPVTVFFKTESAEIKTNNSFIAVGKPIYRQVDGVLKAHNQVFSLNGGEPIDVSFPGAPMDSIKAFIDDKSLETSLQPNSLLVRIPGRSIKDHSLLKFTLYAKPLWSDLVHIIPPLPLIDEKSIRLDLNPEKDIKSTRIAIHSDTSNPDSMVTFLASTSEKKNYEFAYEKSTENKHFFVYPSDDISFDTIDELSVHYVGSVLMKAKGAIKENAEKKLSFEIAEISHTRSDPPDSYARKLPARLMAMLDRFSVDTIKIRNISFQFKGIRGGGDPYYIGLTEKQRANPDLGRLNLANPSSSIQGAAKVRLAHPFFIMTTEVSRAQYLPFLKDMKNSISVPEDLKEYVEQNKELSPEEGEFPVVNVSFIEANKYAGWLQQEFDEHSTGWTVRLPHELEWEMAARNEKEPYTFPQLRLEEGLKSIERPELKPVGSNPLDRSESGVFDLCGNVREWTASVFNPNLLRLIAVLDSSDMKLFWDPSKPHDFEGIEPWKEDKSFNMCVRGGANGEKAIFQQVSIRRQKEHSQTDPQIGFRLVLVPKK